MGALAQPKLTVEQYLALDRAAEIKSEYYDGKMFPLITATYAHSRVAADFTVALGNRLRGRNCRLLAAPRTRVSPTKFVLPDLVVVCGEPKFTDEKVDTITNPKVVVEILSPSTEGFDYSQKLAYYRDLASVDEYLLVAQDRPYVDLYRRMEAPLWSLRTFAGRDAVVELASLGIELPLAEIYEVS